MQYFLAIVQVAGIVTLFSPSFMVCITRVELDDELGTQQEMV